jgi:hypothetical protein
MYKTGALSYAVYACQLSNSIKTNQSLFTAASIFGIVFTLQNTKRLRTIIMALFAFLSVAALVFTFSRTFWIILLLDAIIIMFYIPRNQKKRFIISLSIITAVFIGMAMLVFKQNAGIIFQVIENRLTSSTKGRQDISVMARLIEYKYVIAQINKYPVGGNGLGSKIHFYTPISQTTIYTPNIHNGYMFLAYRLGLPLASIYFFVLIFYLLKAERLTRKFNDTFFKALLLASFLSLLLLVISNFSSEQVFTRDGLMIYSLAIAFIRISEKKGASVGIA